ncbi:MAG: hypothetical protein LBD09_03745, partial [Treponema sp.]|nr:hypothetical protein [Treponema sp.]
MIPGDPPAGPGPFWERNLALLRSRYPGLAEQTAENAGTGSPEAAAGNEVSRWRLERSAAGDPTLSYNGVYVHSSRDPVREGKRRAESALAGSAAPSGEAAS